MAARPAAAAVIIALVTASPALARTQRPANPTQSQIHHALNRAAHSPDLWATINICNPRRFPDQLGIRGQMPALGFPSELTMTIGVQYWASARQKFVPIPGFKKPRLTLGRFSSGFEQGGHTFMFMRHAGLLRGTVTFEYKRAGKPLGSLTRLTTANHKHVDQAHPPGHSAATCTIA